jgi:hypothetical protein
MSVEVDFLLIIVGTTSKRETLEIKIGKIIDLGGTKWKKQ